MPNGPSRNPDPGRPLAGRPVGRRRLLTYAGLTALGAAAAGCGSSSSASGPSQTRPRARPVSRQESAVTRIEQVYSEHRRTMVDLFFAYPSGVETTQGLPVVLYLHGRDGLQPTPVPFGTLEALEEVYSRGTVPPFGFVGVDGGFNPYWHDGSANGDLLSMLTDEVPGWLRSRGLGDEQGLPFAAGGLSTGGFGALNYTIERERGGAPVSALSLLSPALPTTWEQMREKGAFATEQQWQQYDPLQRVGELGDVPLGVWIGESDYFIEGTKQLVDQHSNTPVFETVPGGHEPAVFDSVGDGTIEFLGSSVPRSS